MTTTKIDIRAVHTELTRVAALLSEVARQMGPAVWQGGSAAGFTIDLRGHSRSLEQMMDRVLHVAAAANQSPMTLDVPEITTVASQPSAGLFNQVASVSVEGLRRLETALRRAADALPGHGRRIQALLAEADPVSVSLFQQV